MKRNFSRHCIHILILSIALMLCSDMDAQRPSRSAAARAREQQQRKQQQQRQQEQQQRQQQQQQRQQQQQLKQRQQNEEAARRRREANEEAARRRQEENEEAARRREEENAEAARQRAERDAELNRQAIARVKSDMVAVAGGDFVMGSPAGEPGRGLDERERTVHVDDFHIGKYEVSQRLWTAVMGYNPSSLKNDDKPVENVTWYECQEFIAKLNQKTGMNFRLPTEEEWEYAAKGGRLSKGYRYSGSNDLDAVGWYESNSGTKTQRIGSKQPNELGIYDMSGNVAEWCGDKSSEYRADYGGGRPDVRNGTVCVTRGGSWFLYPEYCRSAARGCEEPGNKSIDLGFRLAY